MRKGKGGALVHGRGLVVDRARPRSRSLCLLCCSDMWIILELGCLIGCLSVVTLPSLARVFRDRDGRKEL